MGRAGTVRRWGVGSFSKHCGPAEEVRWGGSQEQRQTGLRCLEETFPIFQCNQLLAPPWTLVDVTVMEASDFMNWVEESTLRQPFPSFAGKCTWFLHWKQWWTRDLEWTLLWADFQSAGLIKLALSRKSVSRILTSVLIPRIYCIVLHNVMVLILPCHWFFSEWPWESPFPSLRLCFSFFTVQITPQRVVRSKWSSECKVHAW